MAVADAPTLEAVARAAGVSRATVSRVVHGSPRVSPETAAAVTAALTELGYVPNRAARSLVTRRTDSIALVVPESGSRVFTEPFFPQVLRGVTAALAGSDLQLVLLLAQEPEDGARLARYLAGGHVDGAVVVSHHGGDAALHALPLPAVFTGRPLGSPDGDADYVDADNVDGARQAVRHLVERGRRRLATIAGPADMPAGVDRLAGWREAVRAHGLAEDLVGVGDFGVEGGAAAMAALLARDATLDGVFAASDLMAAGALQVLQARGRRVPDDVALVGYDDSVVARTASPPLTSVRQPVEELGRRAVERLLQRVRSGAPPDAPLVLPTELVVRASS